MLVSWLFSSSESQRRCGVDILYLTVYPPVISSPTYRDVAVLPCVSFITLLVLELLALALNIHFVVGSVHSKVKAFPTLSSPVDMSTSPGVTLMTIPANAASYAAIASLGATSTKQTPKDESRLYPSLQILQSLA